MKLKQDRNSISYDNEGYSYYYVLSRQRARATCQGTGKVIHVRQKGILK